MGALLAYAPILAIVTAVGSAFVGIVNALLALRAKARLRSVLTEHATMDAEIRRLMRLASAHRLNKTDTENAREMIEHFVKKLGLEDRRRLEQGLNQTSTSGEQRYISDLLAGGDVEGFEGPVTGQVNKRNKARPS